MPPTPAYAIRHASTRPACDGNLDSPAWWQADVAAISHFRPEGTPGHAPATEEHAGPQGLARLGLVKRF